MISLLQLFSINLKIFLRNKNGLFWTIAMPVGLYAGLSVLPIPSLKGSLDYKDYVLPGMIAYTIMSSGIYTLAYWMVDLKSRGVIKRLSATPIKPWQLILSLVASRIVIMFVQTLIITFVGAVFFEAKFSLNFILPAIFIILGGGVFLTIGLLISNVASSYESAAPLTTIVGMPFTFLGNIFFPAENLPKMLKYVSNVLPITFLTDGLRASYLSFGSWENTGKDILFLSLWLVALLGLTIYTFKLKE
jgi:ABC-2 type transport system permease protein